MRHGQVDACGGLDVGQAAGDERQYLPFAFGQRLQLGGRGAVRGQRADVAGESRRVTLGTTTASPRKLNGYGPRVAVIDTGCIANGLNTSVANAERAGITIDWDHRFRSTAVRPRSIRSPRTG